MWILSTIPLEGPEIIGVTEFGPDFLKDFKIVLLPLVSDCLIEVPPEVSGYAIGIEQRVVNIKKEDDFIFCHITNSFPAPRTFRYRCEFFLSTGVYEIPNSKHQFFN
jgi:hypothetical protein